METYQTLIASLEPPVARIELNRPAIHNAFDDTLIAEMRQVVGLVAADKKFRVLVISGKGKSFCAGADMNWMRRMKSYNFEENLKDSNALSQMFHEIYSLTIPTIAKIQGAAVGGGVGLVAVCDISVATSDAVFSLSEVKLGLVPACICPYLLGRINAGVLRGLFLTGIRFPAHQAKEIGLINEMVDPPQLEMAVEDLVQRVLNCGPNALKMAKELLDRVPQMATPAWMEYTARMIAELRVSAEGQEGLSAFLEKRDPSWRVNPSKNKDQNKN